MKANETTDEKEKAAAGNTNTGVRMQAAGAASLPSGIEAVGMRNSLVGLDGRVDGAGRGGEGADGKKKNQIVPKSLFDEVVERDTAVEVGDGGTNMWWDPQVEERERCRQQQPMDRLRSRLLTSRLSRQDACMQGARRAPRELSEGGEHVTPEAAAMKRADVMRLSVAVPGSQAAAEATPVPAPGGDLDDSNAALLHGGDGTGRPSVEEDDADQLTPLDSAKYVMHRKVQEVMRKVGPTLSKVAQVPCRPPRRPPLHMQLQLRVTLELCTQDTARRLLDRAQGDVRIAIAIARTACLPRTPRTKEAGLAALEKGRQAALRTAAAASGARTKAQPQTRLWEKAARNVAVSSAVTPPCTPPAAGDALSLGSPAPALAPAAVPALHAAPTSDGALSLPSAESAAGSSGRSVFDILPIGRRLCASPDDVSACGGVALDPAKLAMGDESAGCDPAPAVIGAPACVSAATVHVGHIAIETKAPYVSSDPLAADDSKVQMSGALRGRLRDLLGSHASPVAGKPVIESIEQPPAQPCQPCQPAVGARDPKPGEVSGAAHEIELTGVRLMEVGGSELQPVVVPVSSVSQGRLSGELAASLHARLQGAAGRGDKQHRLPRTLPLPPGGSLKTSAAQVDAAQRALESAQASGAPREPLRPVDSNLSPPRDVMKALPSTPKDQSPLRAWGSDAFAPPPAAGRGGAEVRSVTQLAAGMKEARLAACARVESARALETPCSKALKALAREMHLDDHCSPVDEEKAPRPNGCAQTPRSSMLATSLDVTADTPGTQLLQEMRREARDMRQGHAALVSERDAGRAMALPAADCELLLSVGKTARTSPALAVRLLCDACRFLPGFRTASAILGVDGCARVPVCGLCPMPGSLLMLPFALTRRAICSFSPASSPAPRARRAASSHPRRPRGDAGNRRGGARRRCCRRRAVRRVAAALRLDSRRVFWRRVVRGRLARGCTPAARADTWRSDVRRGVGRRVGGAARWRRGDAGADAVAHPLACHRPHPVPLAAVCRRA